MKLCSDLRHGKQSRDRPNGRRFVLRPCSAICGIITA